MHVMLPARHASSDPTRQAVPDRFRASKRSKRGLGTDPSASLWLVRLPGASCPVRLRQPSAVKCSASAHPSSRPPIGDTERREPPCALAGLAPSTLAPLLFLSGRARLV